MTANSNERVDESFGSGYFGQWVSDPFGLPAFRYTCDQVNDPKATTPVNPGLLSSTDHIHQVGNDRIVAVVSNYGWVQVRQDEGAPKILNGYSPERSQFGGGIGYLTDGHSVLSTYYTGSKHPLDRIFGVGYLRKQTAGPSYAVDQVIFAPFGDDPVLRSQVTITNRSDVPADLRWVEYWGCHLYQLSFRLHMMAQAAGVPVAALRHRFGERFSHRFEPLEGQAGLLSSPTFLGHTAEDLQAWTALKPILAANPTMFAGGAVSEPGDEQVRLDDLNPPQTFLASLDAPADNLTTHGADFFGSGGVVDPTGLAGAFKQSLEGNLTATGPDSALLLERRISLAPGESRTLHFLYGYVSNRAQASALIDKYRLGMGGAWAESSAQWVQRSLKFSAPNEPWVARETAWNYYYLRSSTTYDAYFQEHIVSQGAQYIYVMGNQSSARDPLQHALPLIFSDPQLAKEVLRYTVKSIRADGSIPYGMVGNGMPMPTVMDDASDIPLWLLWATSEYVLATRDLAFLDEQVPTYPLYAPAARRDSVRGLLERTYRYLIEHVGTGEHGLIRMLQDDWNDAILTLWVTKEDRPECLTVGESVSNSAMAAYVFDRFARMLEYAGAGSTLATHARNQAEENRRAVRAQWTGKWFRRAWLGPATGWLGERNLWLEPQPWTFIGGAATPEQKEVLVDSLETLLRRPSPIGAMQQAGPGEPLIEGAVRPVGMSVNGGIWPSLNFTLVWALTQVDEAKAWDEWMRNSLAFHAHNYPEVWYATWSGPDSVNAHINERPGRASRSKVFNQEDFPVMNTHSHACALAGITKLLGIEFTQDGVTLAPKLPLASYRFESALLGFIKTGSGYEGWYAPTVGGEWTLNLNLPCAESSEMCVAQVNGDAQRLTQRADGALTLRGRSEPGQPLRWLLRRS